MADYVPIAERAKTMKNVFKLPEQMLLCDGNDNLRAIKDNFQAKTSEESSGCWNWLGAVLNGHLRFTMRLPQYRIQCHARRISWYLFRDDSLPGEVTVSCGNKQCVAPHHLFQGNHRSWIVFGRK